MALTAGYAADASAAPKWAEGRILLQTKAGLSDAELDKVLKGHNGKAIGRIRQINLHIVEVPPQAEEAVARALAKNPNVKFAELDMQVAAEQIPNDPKYTSAWRTCPRSRLQPPGTAARAIMSPSLFWIRASMPAILISPASWSPAGIRFQGTRTPLIFTDMALK